MQSHLGSVDVRGWVQSSFELLRDWWVKGETSAECTIYHDSLAQGHERPGSFLIRIWYLFLFNVTYTINWVTTGFSSTCSNLDKVKTNQLKVLMQLSRVKPSEPSYTRAILAK